MRRWKIGGCSGTLQQLPDGDYLFTPAAGFVGSDTFTWTASDGVATSGTATVTIDVTNKVPFGYNQTYRVQHGETLSGDALSTAADFDGDDGCRRQGRLRLVCRRSKWQSHDRQ